MKKFWVRPDGNDEEEDARFDHRMKILKVLLIVLTMLMFFVAFPYWGKKTDNYWRQEAMRNANMSYMPHKDSIKIRVFEEQ